MNLEYKLKIMTQNADITTMQRNDIGIFDMSVRGFEMGKSSNFNSFSYQNSRKSPAIKREESSINHENLLKHI